MKGGTEKLGVVVGVKGTNLRDALRCYFLRQTTV